MDIEKLKDILQEDRETTSDYHTKLGRSWRQYGEPQKLHAPLAYAAYELRIAMERILLELLYLIKNKQLSPNELNYPFKNLIRALYKTQSNDKNKLQRKLESNALFFKHLPPQQQTAKKLAIIEIDKIDEYWKKLSKYCHYQRKSNATWQNTPWVNRGYELLNEVENFIWKLEVEYQIGWIDTSQLPQAIKDIEKEFVEGKITISSLDIRLNLSLSTVAHQIIIQVSDKTNI